LSSRLFYDEFIKWNKKNNTIFIKTIIENLKIMKKLILITLFSIGMLTVNAQCDCDGPVQTQTFYAIPQGSTTQEWYGTVVYQENPSDNSVCIISIRSNPKIYWGDIPMNMFIKSLMKLNANITAVKIPSNCYSPVLKRKIAGDGLITYYEYTPCSAGCCIIDWSNVDVIFGIGGPRPGNCDPGCYTICD
jgi:hypothetical protein